MNKSVVPEGLNCGRYPYINTLHSTVELCAQVNVYTLTSCLFIVILVSWTVYRLTEALINQEPSRTSATEDHAIF